VAQPLIHLIREIDAKPHRLHLLSRFRFHIWNYRTIVL
jgi:hypothetical protein